MAPIPPYFRTTAVPPSRRSYSHGPAPAPRGSLRTSLCRSWGCAAPIRRRSFSVDIDTAALNASPVSVRKRYLAAGWDGRFVFLGGCRGRLVRSNDAESVYQHAALRLGSSDLRSRGGTRIFSIHSAFIILPLRRVEFRNLTIIFRIDYSSFVDGFIRSQCCSSFAFYPIFEGSSEMGSLLTSYINIFDWPTSLSSFQPNPNISNSWLHRGID